MPALPRSSGSAPQRCIQREQWPTQCELRKNVQGVSAREGGCGPAGIGRAGTQDRIFNDACARLHNHQHRHPRESHVHGVRALPAEATEKIRFICGCLAFILLRPPPDFKWVFSDAVQCYKQGSILCPAFKREIWEAATGELLHLCHEAAERRSEKTGGLVTPLLSCACAVFFAPSLTCACGVQVLFTASFTSTPRQSA